MPRAIAEEIAEPSLEQEQLKAYISKRIHAGEPLWGNYPPSEQTIAEYKASIASGDSDSGAAAAPSPEEQQSRTSERLQRGRDYRANGGAPRGAVCPDGGCRGR